MTTIPEIQAAVAARFRLRVHDLKGDQRILGISQPRKIAMYLCRRLTGASYPAIGLAFGGKDHSTVMHACHHAAVHPDDRVRAAIVELVAQLGGDPPKPGPMPPARTGPRVTIADIARIAGEHLGLTSADLRSRAATDEVSHARSIVVYFARTILRAKYATVCAVAFGGQLSASDARRMSRAVADSREARTRADVAAIQARITAVLTPPPAPDTPSAAVV